MLFARYDMLCFEGISLMLNIFNKRQESPKYRLVPPPGGELEVLTCHESVRMHKSRTPPRCAEEHSRLRESDLSSRVLSCET